jgi:similar to stage IV sporulation protein
MQTNILTYIYGYVELEMIGGDIERLVNRAYSEGLSLWRINWTAPNRIHLHIDLKSFFLLRPLLRDCGCKIRVGRRHGLPFLLAKMETRLFFVAGLLCFILGIYLLSQVVWKVEVTGNERIDYDQVIVAAEEIGIRPFQWKFRLQEPQVLSRQLTQSLDGAAWIGVEIYGTRVKIRIIEQTVPENKPLMNPRHLVSKYDAVVTKIYVEQGKSAVKVNAKVKKGDVLVSGRIGSDEHASIVIAKGNVRGLVWHEYEIRSPLTHTYHSYTGDKKVRYYSVIGKRALQLTGYGELGFAEYDVDTHRSYLAWRDWKLPIGYIREEIKEVRDEQSALTPEDAKRVGLMRARSELIQKSGKDAIIKDEIILHEKTEGGKVYMKVLFEVEQELTAELPII